MGEMSRHFLSRHSISRRQWLAGLAGWGIIPVSSAAFEGKAIALSGNRFEQNGKIHQIADIIAADKDDLLPQARQYAGQSRTALQFLLDEGDMRFVDLELPHRWGYRLIGFPGDRMEADERLVREGAVRVLPVTEDSLKIKRLLQAEEEARQAKRGLWALPFYRVRNANSQSDSDDSVGTVHVFEGVVKDVGQFSGRRFLNFGADYKSDVTVTIESRIVRQWARKPAIEKGQDNFEISELVAKRVRFRGFVEWINGPSVAISHRQALEIL